MCNCKYPFFCINQPLKKILQTDTASVLHEAVGYIRFLQDQVQVLCSPYLQHRPNEENRVKESRKDMKSRGLSIVPVEWTLQVANSNAADYWSLAMGKNFSPPSTAKQ
uniref:BHLH domain-containing protein n=1 Tax=Manihot esculenta TaxID=3983 RepID=A0A2C9VJ67_MANES